MTTKDAKEAKLKTRKREQKRRFFKCRKLGN